MYVMFHMINYLIKSRELMVLQIVFGKGPEITAMQIGVMLHLLVCFHLLILFNHKFWYIFRYKLKFLHGLLRIQSKVIVTQKSELSLLKGLKMLYLLVKNKISWIEWLSNLRNSQCEHENIGKALRKLQSNIDQIFMVYCHRLLTESKVSYKYILSVLDL